MDAQDIRGTVTPGWEPVRDAFLRNFTQRGERGAAVAVYRDGRKVVDVWAGTKDADGETPWALDTAQTVRSVTKGVAAAVPLLLHQRGQLDLDAPVGTYWPAFKAAGKERTSVRHLLAHRAGVPVLDAPLTPQEALDPERAARALAAQAPVWRPGEDHGYHAHTYSWLLDGLVRRVTGRSAGRWVAEEIAGPLGLDLWLGLPLEEAHRVGRLGPAARAAGGRRRAGAAPQALGGGGVRGPGVADAPRVRGDRPVPGRELPGLPRRGSRRVGRYRHGPRAGPVLRGADRPRRRAPAVRPWRRWPRPARRSRPPGPRAGRRHPLRPRLHAARPGGPAAVPGSFGHPGRGGSLAFADPESGTAFGYVTNGMRKGVTADPRAQALVRAVRQVVASLP